MGWVESSPRGQPSPSPTLYPSSKFFEERMETLTTCAGAERDGGNGVVATAGATAVRVQLQYEKLGF